MANQAIAFKSTLPSLTLLKLHSDDLTAVKDTLRQKIKQAPMMFIGMQLVVDLSELSTDIQSLNMVDLRRILSAEGLNPVAIMSDKKSLREAAVAAGMGAIPVVQAQAEKRPRDTDKATSEPEPKSVPSENTVTTATTEATQPLSPEEPKKTFDDTTASNAETNPQPASQIIRHPVRSGQRIYAQGDLTVIGTVSPGAEIIADGHIHVYGALRGRAIAGAQGNENAQIFCQQLDAELVSIAGNYKQLEDIAEDYRSQRVQISLDGEKIRFLPL